MKPILKYRAVCMYLSKTFFTQNLAVFFSHYVRIDSQTFEENTDALLISRDFEVSTSWFLNSFFVATI